MYDITRTQAAKLLGVSTRTIDRYVKSWKVRSKKEWKIVYLNRNDLDTIGSSGSAQQEVIIETKKVEIPKREATTTQVIANESQQEVEVRSNFTKTSLDSIYKDLRTQIQEKDELIQALSLRLGRAEEIAKNSVNLVDYKKSQFLLEESKEHLNKEIEDIKRQKQNLETKLDSERKYNLILIIATIILFVVAVTIFFIEAGQ